MVRYILLITKNYRGPSLAQRESELSWPVRTAVTHEACFRFLVAVAQRFSLQRLMLMAMAPAPTRVREC